MILPTRTAAIVAAAGAPLALVVAVAVPAHWYAGLAWPIAVLLLTAADALLAPRSGSASLSVPASAPVGASVDLAVEARIAGAVRAAEVAIAADPLLAVDNDGRAWIALEQGRGAGLVLVTTLRRGTARIATIVTRTIGGRA